LITTFSGFIKAREKKRTEEKRREEDRKRLRGGTEEEKRRRIADLHSSVSSQRNRGG
jgi:hypothetical protein